MAQPLGREDRAKVLYSHVDADADIQLGMRLMREGVMRFVEAHAAFDRASKSLVEANRIISQLGCREEVAA